jgi:hypothetical protein
MSDELTTVSWKVIEPGWKVLAADGDEIGEVYQTVGDENADIFDGLAICHYGGPALLHDFADKPRYVRADKVAAIQPGVVRLTLSREQAHDLPEHEAMKSIRILNEGSGLIDRIEDTLGKLGGGDRLA